MKIMMAFPSRGEFSGGGRTTMRSLVPRLLDSNAVEALHVGVPKAEQASLGDLPVETWPANAGLKGACDWLRERCSQLRPDVLLLTNAHWIDVGDVPVVCTVRNTEPMVRPLRGNPLRHGLRCVLRGMATKRSARRATRVIGVSGFVRDLLIDRWGIDGETVGVVHHGVEAPIPDSHMARPPAAAAVDEGLFVFSAGDFTAYRGYEDLVEAVAARRDRGCHDRVLLAGGPIPWLQREQGRVEKLIAARGVGDRVTLLGRIPPEQMAWCYRHCKAMVMTSRIEACPNVTLEAMSHGCTILSTTNPPMPEMFDDVAMYYDAGQPEALAVLLAAVDDMTDEERAHRSRATVDRARECFSWDRATTKTLAQLRLAMEAARP